MNSDVSPVARTDVKTGASDPALSLYHLLDPEVLANPYPLYHRLRNEGAKAWAAVEKASGRLGEGGTDSLRQRVSDVRKALEREQADQHGHE